MLFTQLNLEGSKKIDFKHSQTSFMIRFGNNLSKFFSKVMNKNIYKFRVIVKVKEI